jgi:hypothetical protein
MVELYNGINERHFGNFFYDGKRKIKLQNVKLVKASTKIHELDNNFLVSLFVLWKLHIHCI